MNFKKIQSKFWARKASGEAGFTLVELIVVIAILGILAGVGVVGYNGYIKKANVAADEQLLAVVNQAFAAACLENGVDMNSLTSATAVLADDKTVANVYVTAVDDAFDVAFDKYYAGNEDSAFKVFEGIYFDPELHVFTQEAKALFVIEIDGQTFTIAVDAKDVESLKNSTFFTMGMDGLTTQLDDVIGIAKTLNENGGNAYGKIIASEGFVAAAMNALGVDSAADYNTAATALITQIAQQNNITPAEAKDLLEARAAVLYTAQQTANMSVADATELFSSATTQGIVDKMMAGDGEGLAQAALVCGMYTAYVNNSGNGIEDKTVDTSTVIEALNDPNFMAYINDPQGQKDLEGYLGSLSMVNSSIGETAAVENILVNGFNNENFVSALEGLVG